MEAGSWNQVNFLENGSKVMKKAGSKRGSVSFWEELEVVVAQPEKKNLKQSLKKNAERR